MSLIPTYALYGEPGTRQDAEFVHCESIQERSRLHDYRIDAHRHDQLFQMLLLVEGGGEVAFDAVTATLIQPCLVITPATVVHRYSFLSMVDGFVVTLYQSEFDRIVRACSGAAHCFRRPQVVRLDEDAGAAATITASVRLLNAEFGGHAPDRPGMMEACLMQAWIAAYRVQARSAGQAQPALARGMAYANRFRDMVDRDFQRRRPVEGYAAALGMTPVHLRRLCHAHFGTTPKGVLNARAILEAKRLLVFSALGIQEVAFAAGFDDHAYFSRFFRRETGLTPTEFRARQRRTGP